MQGAGRLRKLIAVHDIVLRDAGDARGQVAQDIGEQTEVDVHVNRLMDVVGPRPLESQRDAISSRCASNRDERSNVPI